MKGLLAYGINTITIDEQEVDWQEELNEVILNNQDTTGYWQNGGYPNHETDQYRVYYTAWAMMTLLRSVPTIAVTGIETTCLSKELAVGKTATLKATVKPADATNPSVIWASSDPSVATVGDGAVTTLKAGSSIISVTTVDGDYKATCTLVVKALQDFVKVEIVDPNELNVKADKLDKSVLFTVDEVEQDSIIRLSVELLDSSKVGQNERTLLENFVNTNIKSEATELAYLDVSLYKIVGQEQTKLVSSLQPITITFILPKDLREKEFKLLRLHDGKVDELNFEYNKATFEITFVTDKFSTYAMAYGISTQIVNTSDETYNGGWLLIAGLFLLLISYTYKKETIE
jgi:transglutaminase/protease-like cytokinesis protein 3